MSAVTPARFEEIVGQEEALRFLRGICASGRFPPALLFVGPSSVGKGLAARALAWTAGCESGTACGRCAGCAANAYGEGLRAIDLAEVFADEQVKTKVDALRSFLTAQASAHTLARRIAFIDHAELMNDAMQGTLLKAIEEPPPRVTYVLAAESVSMLAATIRSRTLIIRFRPLAASDLAAILSHRAPSAGPVPADLLAAAQGSVARAEALRAEYAEVAELVTAVLGKNPARGTKRAEVQEKLALAIPAAAALHPAWRDSLLALDAAVAANAHLGLAWSVFRAAAEAAENRGPKRRVETPGGARGGDRAVSPAGVHGGIARRSPGGNMLGMP